VEIDPPILQLLSLRPLFELLLAVASFPATDT